MHAVGIVGCGVMGSALARRLLKNGFQVDVYDAKYEAAQALVADGAHTVGSPRDLAGCPVVLVAVVDDDQVIEVCLGSDGILAGAAGGTVVSILSTVSPQTCRDVEQHAYAKGVSVLDVPMIRGATAASEGKLLLLVGGNSEALARCRPVFETFADDIRHVGSVGNAQVAKAVNNLLMWVSIAGIRESVALASNLGFKPAALRAALIGSSAESWALREWERACGQAVWWNQKDLAGVLKLADECELAMPLTAFVREALKDWNPNDARTLFK